MTGDIGSASVDAIGAEANGMAAFLGNPSCKAALLIIDGRLRQASETAQPEELLNVIARAHIPIAAAISGDCAGTGLLLALACHFRFAAEDGMFHFPAVTRFEKFGRLLRDIGSAPEISAGNLAGKSLAAVTACKYGIIDSVTKRGNTRRRATDFLQSLTRNRSLRCIRAAMQSIQNSYTMTIEEALREESRLFDERVREFAGESGDSALVF